jgi:hypothetical protein
MDHDDFARIAECVHAIEQERWEAEMDRDASSGTLPADIQRLAIKN